MRLPQSISLEASRLVLEGLLSDVRVSDALKLYREIRGFTQRECARELEIPYRTIQDWENGRRFPRPKNYIALRELLLETC